MMKIMLLTCAFITSTTWGFVPTVESLFRHGSNPDVTADGVTLTLNIKRINQGEKTISNITDASLLRSEREEDFYKVYFAKKDNTLRLVQVRYSNGDYSDNAIEHKLYYPNFTSYTVKADWEQAEKGLFFGVLQSLVLNDGAPLLKYLKALEVPVKLNDEIINREKVELLAAYKRYLIITGKDRNARKTEINPLKPEEKEARDRADEVMAQPMYVDTEQVKLGRDDGSISWIVNAGTLDSVFTYKMRDLSKVKLKSPLGDIEMIFKDYWLANGTHSLPRFILIRSLSGEAYQVELTNLRHHVVKEAEFVKQLNGWDQTLKGKVSTEVRPPFML